MEKISAIVPAHNEEKHIGNCLASVRAAAERIDLPVEIVVVLNRCTDATEEIAVQYDARTIEEDACNLAKIRNAGIRSASGDVIVTIDADSWMTTNMLQEVHRHLSCRRYIAGGVRIRPERLSVGILCSLMMVAPYVMLARVSAGLFWVTRKVFEAVGGFDERLISAEDYHFAVKLKRFGAAQGLRYGTIRRAHIVTSCRKFDQFGDWYLFKNPRLVKEIFNGRNRQAADHFYYKARKVVMDDFSQNKYTTGEVTRVIRRALELKREETVSHQDLLHTAQELGLDPETVADAVRQEKADFEKERAHKARLQRRKAGFRRHLWSFIIVNAGLFLINAVTPGTWWFQWPLLVWGMGLIFKLRAAYFPVSSSHKHKA